MFYDNSGFCARRMNWHDLLPTHIAAAQITWERDRQAHRLHSLGFTYKKIAARMGVSIERVRQYDLRFQRFQRYRKSPVEEWLDRDPIDDLEALVRRLPKERRKNFPAARPSSLGRDAAKGW